MNNKQKLEKIESGEFVLLRKSEFNVFYTDNNQCLDEENIKEFGENCEFGQILEIRKERHIFLDPINLHGTWNKDETNFFIGSRDEAEAMLEAVEKNHE